MKAEKKNKTNLIKYLLDDALPLYVPKSRRFSDKLHLAIWNCGKRPQTTLQALKDVRITIRKNNEPILVIKKGDIQ